MGKINKEKIKTWFVTGASSGVGYEIVKQLLKRGYNVIAVARRIPDFVAPNCLCLSCDVTNPIMVKNAIQEGMQKFGKIDVLVNNAGTTAGILCEDETIEHMKAVMDVNYFGAFNTIKELLPYFRKNCNGTIINNTSMHGLSIRSYGSAYCSSKHALEGLTSVIKHETASFCRVMAFELGFYEGTDIVKNSVGIKNTKKEYNNLRIFYKPFNYHNYVNHLDKTIELIIDTVEQNNLPRHLILGRDAVFKVKTELDILMKDLKLANKNLKKCTSLIKQDFTFNYLKDFISYFKYKLLKNIVFGKTRQRYKYKQIKYKRKLNF